ncbi:terminus macrodomain insulation protein YfbV [uncultured Ferrimonas sp.]|uniref:terminus macrodomain insulation protein YfbV n=1 Tax=uncultured Ferrimonas sp. TaxID=432640 RepID=UPI003421AA8F
MSLYRRIRAGYDYMQKWPLNKMLASRFPEYRVIKSTRFAIMWMPVVAMVCAAVQIMFGGELTPLFWAQCLFILSIPFQGLYWLGWRAVQPLPLPVLHWCKEVRQRLVEAGCDEAPMASVSQYQHMACLLERAFKRLDSAFWRDN